MRVLSYNVHKCVGGVDRRLSPSRVAEAIAHYDPDVALLQEAVVGGPREGQSDQVALLGDLLGYRHRVFVPEAACRGGGRYGNAVLSRHPIAGASRIDLTVSWKKRRGALHARLRLRLSPGRVRTLHVYNLHLGLSGIERRIQLRRFLASHPFAGLHARTPILLGGDFNDVWGTLGRAILEPAGFRGLPRRRPTFPAVAPLRALDAVYARGDVHLAPSPRTRPKAARFASDHLPVAADAAFR